jgi:tRNA pseudouridine13 synthase
MSGIPHPYLTASLPGVGGFMKSRVEDFQVDEVPLYDPSGEGEHTYFGLRKENLSTLEALERLASRLRVDVKQFGYAGLKDRKGVTTQTLSLSGVDPEAVRALELPQVSILWVSRHTNKLRVGHLRGNVFRIWVRGVVPDAEERAAPILDILERGGLPNYYGFQRFGNRGNAHRIGRAFLRDDDGWAIHRILGFPSSAENNPHVVDARERFMAGNLEGALDAYPPAYREERRMLGYLLRHPDDYSGARARMRQTALKLYLSAYQSYIFNLILAERLRRTGGDLGTLLCGDLAQIHRNGAVFLVEDPSAEAARALALEISPSGPIFGRNMPAAGGVEAEIEREVLGRESAVPEDFHRLAPSLHLDGGRRPFRVPVESLRWRLDGGDLYLEFFLPKGAYATTLLRELMKTEAPVDGFYEDGEEEKHGLWRPPAGELAGEEEPAGESAGEAEEPAGEGSP